VKERLKKVLAKSGKKTWTKEVERVEGLINNSVNLTTGFIPNELRSGLRRDGTMADPDALQSWRSGAIMRTRKMQERCNRRLLSKQGKKDKLKIGDRVIMRRAAGGQRRAFLLAI